MSTPSGSAARHVREHRSLLAAAEKRALIWLAQRLPTSVTSDHLSLLGLASMLVAGAAFAAFPWAGGAAAATIVAALCVNWFGDSLDGTVARVRGQERPRYGYYVDHAIDLAGSTALLSGLAVSGLMQPIVALAVLASYLLVAAETYLATHAAGTFRMSFAGVGPTELRILLAIGTIKAAMDPRIEVILVGNVGLFDVGGIIACVGLVSTFTWSAVRNTGALYAAEPVRREATAA